jgi:hypothetical protein
MLVAGAAMFCGRDLMARRCRRIEVVVAEEDSAGVVVVEEAADGAARGTGGTAIEEVGIEHPTSSCACGNGERQPFLEAISRDSRL